MYQFNIISLPETDSTNNYARQLLRNGHPEPFTIVHSLSQTHGRGQGQNKWYSVPGQSITCSIIFYPPVRPEQQYRISKAIALGVCDLLAKLNIRAQIKWPNDIIAEGRKLAGILIENSLQTDAIRWTIAGIGLNVNHPDFPDELPHAVSLRMLTGIEYDLMTLLSDLAKACYLRCLQLEDNYSEIIDRDFRENLFQFRSVVRLRRLGQLITGILYDVDMLGRLILKDNDNRMIMVNHADTQWENGGSLSDSGNNSRGCYPEAKPR